ncbi:MAG: RNA polymerase sigma factor SigF [Desertifilum sp.]|nr:RNA polymerase sigma factor SigF [Desertifilum sp.]MDI9640538.1 RNA polymerase sigma factor SigF [Geitlerinema splendidum]
MLTNQSSLRFRGMELLIAYYQTPTVEIRNQLVQMNIGLVRKIAHRVSRQCTEPYEDLEQIGCLGLIRAIERFNPSQGCAFSSFAVPYIRGEMLHYLRDRSGVVKIPRRWQDLKKDGQKVREELTKSLGRLPSDTEVAQELNVSVQEWTEAKMTDQNRQPLSLDAKIGQQMDNVVTLGETLPDSHYQILQELDEERQQLQNALSQLEETTRAAIEFVMVNGLSRKEVAEKIGVSPMTVSRRIQRGIEQMISFVQPQSLQTEP